jgi:hypothetical protein
VLLRLGLQPDGVERRQHQIEGQGLGDDAAAGRQHHQFPARQQLPERGLLHAAETLLAVQGDDLGHRQPVLSLDLLVELDKAPADLIRQQLGGFAGAVSAGQGDAGESEGARFTAPSLFRFPERLWLASPAQWSAGWRGSAVAANP